MPMLLLNINCQRLWYVYYW